MSSNEALAYFAIGTLFLIPFGIALFRRLDTLGAHQVLNIDAFTVIGVVTLIKAPGCLDLKKESGEVTHYDLDTKNVRGVQKIKVGDKVNLRICDDPSLDLPALLGFKILTNAPESVTKS